MVGVNICYCPWNWELQKSKDAPWVKYGRGKHLLLTFEKGSSRMFKHPPTVKNGRAKHLLLLFELVTAEVLKSSFG